MGRELNLSLLLTKFGIHSQANCSCNKRAVEMDKKGNDWVEENMNTVVGWLKKKLEKRLPFLKDNRGKILVKKLLLILGKSKQLDLKKKKKRKMITGTYLCNHDRVAVCHQHPYV